MKQTLFPRQIVVYSGWVVVGLLLTACVPLEASPTPTQSVAEAVGATAVPPTSTAQPSATPLPTVTLTAKATVTISPTLTAVGSTDVGPTVVGTETPSPSATATSLPTATFTPLPPAATNTPAIANPTLGSLGDYLGQEVTLNGTVVATASFARGFKFTLDDGTGRVTLLLWDNVYDDCWDAPQLNIGSSVRATGEVGQFEGELQLVPDFGGDVKVTAVGGPFAPAQTIGSLGDYMGQLVMITGQISRVEGTSNGAKLFVTDESGEILVFVWNTVLERVPNNTALGIPGTQVRVVGAVQEFRSNREIVPSLPYDIEVLP